MEAFLDLVKTWVTSPVLPLSLPVNTITLSPLIILEGIREPPEQVKQFS